MVWLFLNKLNPQPTWVKQDADLAADFKMSVGSHTNDTTVFIVVFDCYRDISIKQATRTSREGERAPHAFHISVKSNIDKVAMSRLLFFTENFS